jgi:arylsulfatase A-like enzyme
VKHNRTTRSLARTVVVVMALTPALAGSLPGPTAKAGSADSARSVSATGQPAADAYSGPPNILVMVADDQAWNTFSRDLMPDVWSQLVDQGVLFNRYYVNQSECCPSRSEMLTGLYAQHTGVDSNNVELNRPTIASALHDQGYRTMISGKFLNSMPCGTPRPEYDDWVCSGGTDAPDDGRGFVNPILNVAGVWTRFLGFTTDIEANQLVASMQATPKDQPFFATYAPTSPHLPANDPRCVNMPVDPLRDPGYYDDTRTDGKPKYMQRDAFSTEEAALVDLDHQHMTDAVKCLDNSMDIVLSGLHAMPSREQNTIVFYLSDNGFLYGEHRREGKVVPYEESMRLPLVVRYPPLVPESQPFATDALAENVDIGSTIADLVGFPWGGDGVSLLPLLDGSSTSVRDSVLIENCEAASYPCTGGSSPDIQNDDGLYPIPADSPLAITGRTRVPPFYGIVTDQYKYIEYQTREKELYDFAVDPYEIINLAGNPEYEAVQADLASQLAVLESAPPVDTTIATGPSGPMAGRVATFTYFSQDRHATFECRITRNSKVGDWSPCNGGGVTLGGLADGSYTLDVAGTDTTGQTDTSPASRSFAISSTGPDVTVATHPEAHETGRRLDFTFRSPVPGATFQCSLEPLGTDPVFSPCDPTQTLTYTGLDDGQWDFQVEATDPSGGGTTSPPAEWLTDLDNVGPDMINLLNTDVSVPINRTTISYDFYPDEATTGPWTCQLDAKAPTDCSLGHYSAKNLTEGSHALTISGTDTVGNVRGTTFPLTVDLTPPVATITSGPPSPTNSRTATFTFASNESGFFRCSLDGADYTTCTTPWTVANLAEGQHGMAVKAVDAAGNQSHAATYRWIVDLTPPTVTLKSVPPQMTQLTHATFRWKSEHGATFQCSLDDSALADCTPPAQYSGLADGQHLFKVVATDLAGNTGDPTSYLWTVDTVSPTITITSEPPDPSPDPSATFEFRSTDPTATFTCALDGAPPQACTSPITYDGLANGTHTFVVTATDPAGNSRQASYTWTVQPLGLARRVL